MVMKKCCLRARNVSYRKEIYVLTEVHPGFPQAYKIENFGAIVNDF